MVLFPVLFSVYFLSILVVIFTYFASLLRSQRFKKVVKAVLCPSICIALLSGTLLQIYFPSESKFTYYIHWVGLMSWAFFLIMECREMKPRLIKWIKNFWLEEVKGKKV